MTTNEKRQEALDKMSREVSAAVRIASRAGVSEADIARSLYAKSVEMATKSLTPHVAIKPAK